MLFPGAPELAMIRDTSSWSEQRECVTTAKTLVNCVEYLSCETLVKLTNWADRRVVDRTRPLKLVIALPGRCTHA